MNPIAIVTLYFITVLFVVISPPWQVVVVAGSADQHVFDNAADYFVKKMDEHGVYSTQLSSSRLKTGFVQKTNIPMASLDNIEKALSGYGPCFLYLTTHGSPGGYMQVGREVLSPELLDNILEKACGDAPGILIVSGCFSGEYTNLQYTRPNWTIMTASRSDRSSFGCSNDYQYTYWDGCFFKAIDSGKKNFQSIYAEVNKCVRILEDKLDIPPEKYSEPQFYMGEESPKELPW